MEEGKFEQAILRLSRLLQQRNQMSSNGGCLVESLIELVSDAGDAKHLDSVSMNFCADVWNEHQGAVTLRGTTALFCSRSICMTSRAWFTSQNLGPKNFLRVRMLSVLVEKGRCTSVRAFIIAR